MLLAFTIGIILLSVKMNYAQSFQFGNVTGNGIIGWTTSTVTGVGFGDFNTANQNISSALHINTNLTTAQSGVGAFGLGEVFRTQSPTTLIQAWRMYIGSGGGTQIFNIKNDNTSGSNNISLETFQNDGAIIFNTSPNTERMRIYDENFITPVALIANPGMVRIGKSGGPDPNGFGPILKKPKLLVAGSEQNLISAEGNYVVAEFRSQFETSSSAGIKIRGSRYSKTHLCTAQIDFANYDYDESPPVEFNLARLCADMLDEHDQKSFFILIREMIMTTSILNFLLIT
ncbi:MAG: hypothetical protein LH473_12090 [Chitinophagales bacterium]|nr:hypothetical protein [Chitinophagales bacterium]